MYLPVVIDGVEKTLVRDKTGIHFVDDKYTFSKGCELLAMFPVFDGNEELYGHISENVLYVMVKGESDPWIEVMITNGKMWMRGTLGKMSLKANSFVQRWNDIENFDPGEVMAVRFQFIYDTLMAYVLQNDEIKVYTIEQFVETLGEEAGWYLDNIYKFLKS